MTSSGEVPSNQVEFATVLITMETYGQLAVVARQDKTTVSQVIADALARYIKEKRR